MVYPRSIGFSRAVSVVRVCVGQLLWDRAERSPIKTLVFRNWKAYTYKNEFNLKGYDTMKKAVEMTDGKALLEASGNITDETIGEVAQTGVDIISIGALTHSVKAFDISMKIK